MRLCFQIINGKTYVDIVGKVVPGTSSEVSGPLGLSTDAPVELGEVGSNSDFQLFKLLIEETSFD